MSIAPPTTKQTLEDCRCLDCSQKTYEKSSSNETNNSGVCVCVYNEGFQNNIELPPTKAVIVTK